MNTCGRPKKQSLICVGNLEGSHLYLIKKTEGSRTLSILVKEAVFNNWRKSKKYLSIFVENPRM